LQAVTTLQDTTSESKHSPPMHRAAKAIATATFRRKPNSRVSQYAVLSAIVINTLG
jgi:hypothetical protein